MMTDDTKMLVEKLRAEHEQVMASLRTGLLHARQAGQLLLAEKKRVEHGNWLQHLAALCKEAGIKERTANLYMQIAKSATTDADLPKNMTINQFVGNIREAKRSIRATELKQNREEAIQHCAQPAEDRYIINNADCRDFPWPEQVDVVATDPPWEDMDAYEWLAVFINNRLKPGGIALVQCGTAEIASVLSIMTKDFGELHPIIYRWTLAIAFDKPFPMTSAMPLAISWRPILLFSKGDWNYSGLTAKLSDVSTVPLSVYNKTHHPWQQPVAAWSYWLQGLTRPGELVVDCFAGSGTSGAALKMVGGRRFLGTERDAEHAKVAQGRINMTEEGRFPIRKKVAA